MNQSERDVKLGRFISLVLRHNPAAASIALDANGWADVQQLLDGMNRAGKAIDKETLARIVRENNKSRYSFNADESKIRANQGHSVPVDVELKPQTPPDVLYHGTAERFLEPILRDGLSPRSRQHVHLSVDTETAVNVGSRHGKPVVLAIDAADMARDGHDFWLSENHVWLCMAVPSRYIRLL